MNQIVVAYSKTQKVSIQNRALSNFIAGLTPVAIKALLVRRLSGKKVKPPEAIFNLEEDSEASIQNEAYGYNNETESFVYENELEWFTTSEIRKKGVEQYAMVSGLSVIFWDTLLTVNKVGFALDWASIIPIKSPILVLSCKATFPDQIVFIYNGTEESVRCITSFITLFEKQTKHKEVTLLATGSSTESLMLGEEIIINHLKRHYKNVGVQIMDQIKESEISTVLQWSEHFILVGGISLFTTMSFQTLEEIVVNKKSPLFLFNP